MQEILITSSTQSILYTYFQKLFVWTFQPINHLFCSQLDTTESIPSLSFIILFFFIILIYTTEYDSKNDILERSDSSIL